MKIINYPLFLLVVLATSFSLNAMHIQGHSPIVLSSKKPELKPLSDDDKNNSLEHFADNFSLDDDSIDGRIGRICDPCCGLCFKLITYFSTSKNKIKDK